ncbi:MAG: FAD-dependent oxidoreductase, partial [Acetobacteraceae bacterium]|nr:FAD-dependent oxidoreductase [Acetobacteraceae bacterium]
AGLPLAPGATIVTGPAEWEALSPGTGGALYGAAAHGWQQSFDRPGSRTRLPGLYLAGGGTHPGAGLAMAALSGRLAAQSILEDRRP